MTSTPGHDPFERRDVPADRRANHRGGLIARNRELAHIDQFLYQARRGKAGAIGFHGECGVGKSALIEAAVTRATEFHTVQVRGRAHSEAPALPRLWPDALTELAVHLDTPAPDAPRFSGPGHVPAAAPAAPSVQAVEAAVAAFRRMIVAAGGPLLVTVDDCQSVPAELVTAMATAVLSHLGGEPVSLVLAWRDTPHLEALCLDRSDVPVHRLTGFTVGQARQLLSSRSDQPPSEPVLAELVARTGGNPMVLLDVSSQLAPAQLAGWHPLPDPLPLSGVAAEAFDVARYLPPATRRALTVVAAGKAPKEAVLEAMKRLGAAPADLAPALDTGVIYERGPRLDFRHPLVRSAAFYRAPPEVRQLVRRTLSAVLAEGDAIEASAYHASIDTVAPDELAARRLAEAARVALDRGDPVAAARHEELAARCSGNVNMVAQHLADAASLWAASGARERARYCVESAAELDAGAVVAAEVSYQRARLAEPGDPSGPDDMVGAALACVGDRPQRAVAMLVDAAAWHILANAPVAAGRIAERAVSIAKAVSSHSEVLAHTVRAAAALAAGEEIDDIAERGHVSLLVGQTERFPSSPEVALVIGGSLAQQGMRRQARRWIQWVERCAEDCGDVALAVVPPLLEGALQLAAGDLDGAEDAAMTGAAAADEAGSIVVAAHAWQLAVQVHAVGGKYGEGFSDSARVFALTERMSTVARLRTLPALALLELQRGRASGAVAWVRSVADDVDAFEHANSGTSAATADIAPLVATVFFLARATEELRQWTTLLEAVDAPGRGGARGGRSALGVDDWLRGLTMADPVDAVAQLGAASAAFEDRPVLQALIEICRAVRSARGGAPTHAVERLEAVEHRMRILRATGIAALAAIERDHVAQGSSPGVGLADGRPSGEAVLRVEGATRSAGGDGSPGDTDGLLALVEWELSVLGGFSIRHHGKPVALPPSLAAQAVKIVALHPRITVEELIELLWEDAEPGVGARRLRNVLWRIRCACGDLLVRDGNVLRLAHGAATDLERFRTLADQALVGADAGTPRAPETARAALESYRGEVLPGDRYADWAAAVRESSARIHLRLLDLLVEDALTCHRQAEALVLLDRLAEHDPYDERHHLRTAEIHLDAGNRGRALEALERAERMLAELQVAPSPAVQRLRERLDRS